MATEGFQQLRYLTLYECIAVISPPLYLFQALRSLKLIQCNIRSIGFLSPTSNYNEKRKKELTSDSNPNNNNHSNNNNNNNNNNDNNNNNISISQNDTTENSNTTSRSNNTDDSKSNSIDNSNYSNNSNDNNNNGNSSEGQPRYFSNLEYLELKRCEWITDATPILSVVTQLVKLDLEGIVIGIPYYYYYVSIPSSPLPFSLSSPSTNLRLQTNG